MLGRERVVLHALMTAGLPREKLTLVKMLFLVRQETDVGRQIPFYDFLPYQFGPFSFVLYNDLRRLTETGLLSDAGDQLALAPSGRALGAIRPLTPAIAGAVASVVARYGTMSTRQLVRHVYRHYPWYASRSRLVPATPRNPAPPAAYTVGYEGRSLDAFIDLLLRRGVARVLDVRKNAYSMKYGFTGAALRSTCEKCGLSYHHMPELGVPSVDRRDLSTPEAVERVLGHYETDILPMQAAAVRRVADYQAELPSALLCYEADASSCHRGRLAAAVGAMSGLEVVHL
jgi:uncharacterized protein (DUF488 family)